MANKPKVERTQKAKDLPPPTAFEVMPPAMGTTPRVSANAGVSATNLAVKARRDENRRESLGPGLDGILNISRQSGNGVVTGRAAEAARYMAGGLRNNIKEEAGILVEEGAVDGRRGSGQHRAATYVHAQTEFVEKVDRALVTLQDAVRSFPRNAQRTSVAEAHQALLDSFEPLAKMGYRTVAAAMLDLVVAKAAAANLDRFTAAGDDRQIFMARLMAVQHDALVVLPERGKRVDRRMEMPQVVGFAVPTGDGRMQPVGINLRDGGQKIVVAGTLVRDAKSGLTEKVAQKEISFSEFLKRFDIAYEAAEGEARYVPQAVIEQLREKGVEAIALPAREADLLPEGIMERLVGADFVGQGVTRQIAQIDALIRTLEDAVSTEAKSTLAEFDTPRDGAEESIVTQVARKQCASDAGEEVVEMMRERIKSDFERNIRARLEVEYGLGGLRVLGAFANYFSTRKSFPDQVGESVYKHGFPKRLSAFLRGAGWEGGGRLDEKNVRVKPDARFQDLDKVLNRAGQTYRDKFMSLDVIEREIAVQSEAIREIRALLQEKDYGGFSAEALQEVLGEDAIQDYAASYRDEVAGVKEAYEGYRKAARKAVADALAGVMMSRRQAIPGMIESDPSSEFGFEEREERMDLVRERMEVFLGIQEDRFLKRGRKKSDDAEKVDRAIRSFLEVDRDGRFKDRFLSVAVMDPTRIENERSPMLESLETFREVSVVVDSLEDTIGTLRYEYENANRLLRNAYPRDHKDDLMRPTSGAMTAVTPQVLNPSHPMDLIARSASGGYLVYSVKPELNGLFKVQPPKAATRIDLAGIVDRNNQQDVRTIVYAWTSKKGDMSPAKAVEGIDGIALDRFSRRKLAWATVEPGELFENMGILPASGYLPKIGGKLGAAWNRSYRDEQGKHVREAFDRPHLPLPTTDGGPNRVVWFPLPEKPDQVAECMERLVTWFDKRAEDRIKDPAIFDRYERFKEEGLLRVRKSFDLYASGVRDFAWLAPGFGVSGGVNSASILGFAAYRIPEKDAGERSYQVAFKQHGVEAIKEVLRGFSETGCLVAPVIVTADEDSNEGSQK